MIPTTTNNHLTIVFASFQSPRSGEVIPTRSVDPHPRLPEVSVASERRGDSYPFQNYKVELYREVSVASERRGDSYEEIEQIPKGYMLQFQSPRSGEVIPTSQASVWDGEFRICFSRLGAAR